MGFWQNVFSSNSGSHIYTPHVEYLNADEFQAWANPSQMSAVQMWSTQPHFRTVVSFRARNMAQLGVHTFERVGNTDRRRNKTSLLAMSLEEVDGSTTPYELIFATVGDIDLFDRAYWWVAPSLETESGWMIRRLPPNWVRKIRKSPWEAKEYQVSWGEDSIKLPPDRVLEFPGYHPSKAHGSSPTVDALKQTLQEQVEAALYRSQVWKRGGRVSAVIERPAKTRPWSPEAREAFREDWYAKFTGKGKGSGGTPILEDGMQLKRIDFNAQEQQFVEAAKLSLVTVASAFHVNPTMIGQNEGANYSNVREFRKMLYGDTLGPIVAQLENRINTFLVPKIEGSRKQFYVEFNIAEKLQGNFEEQAAALQTSVGGPWMTRAEARAIQNLKFIEGTEELIVPMNVIEGGQASPTDSGSQNRRSFRVIMKSSAEVEELTDFFARQSAAVMSRLGAKAAWWDEERWNSELAGILGEIYLGRSVSAAQVALRDAGYDPDDFNESRILNYLKASSLTSAANINRATREAVEEAIKSDDDTKEAVARVFETAKNARAPEIVKTASTFAIGFGVVEAARQKVEGGERQATKTWRTRSSNPRRSHKRMNGETVKIDDDFSNGLPWPGAMGSDASETANCTCSVTIQIEE